MGWKFIKNCFFLIILFFGNIAVFIFLYNQSFIDKLIKNYGPYNNTDTEVFFQVNETVEELEEDIVVPDDTATAFHHLMEERRLKKSRACEKVRSGHPKNLRSRTLHTRVYYLPRTKLLWCPVFKASSTNWMMNIITLSGISPVRRRLLEEKYKKQPNQQARSVAPQISSLQLQAIGRDENIFKMMIVRHPFSRLLSAFRDKFEKCTTDFDCTKQKDWYFHRQGMGFVRKYRKLAINKFGTEFFSEKKNFGAPFRVEKRVNNQLPSWWEFIQHVLHTDAGLFDEHYRPVYYLCGSCDFDYNYILQYEKIKTEESLFVEELGASEAIKPQWENSNKRNISDTDLLAAYFELLSNEEIKKLYNIYRPDFEQFNYSFEFREITYNMPTTTEN